MRDCESTHFQKWSDDILVSRLRCLRDDQFLDDCGRNQVNGVVFESGHGVVSEQLFQIRKHTTIECVELFVSVGQRWVFHERNIDSLNGFEVGHGHTGVAPSGGKRCEGRLEEVLFGVVTCWLTGERRVADAVDYRQKAGESTQFILELGINQKL